MENKRTYTIHLRDVVNDAFNDNAEVRVKFASGEVYDASYFTLANLRTIMERHATTGESAGGTYFWWPHMVIVRELTRESIEVSINDLLKEDEFELVFERINDVE